MTNLLIFLLFFLAVCLFTVIFVGMALFEHHSEEIEDDEWESGEPYNPYEEDNVIFKA